MWDAAMLTVYADRQTDVLVHPRAVENAFLFWSASYQLISYKGECFRHAGTTDTLPSHDLAHLLVAAISGLDWNPGIEATARQAEYNAVLLENFLMHAYLSPTRSPRDVADATMRHMSWFVEDHYAPFPLTAAESLTCFLDAASPARVAELCHFFLWQLQAERACQLRAVEWHVSLSPLGNCAQDHSLIRYQQFVFEAYTALQAAGRCAAIT
jgi:hypothetical protein